MLNVRLETFWKKKLLVENELKKMKIEILVLLAATRKFDHGKIIDKL